jgi:hypothetical protein
MGFAAGKQTLDDGWVSNMALISDFSKAYYTAHY